VSVKKYIRVRNLQGFDRYYECSSNTLSDSSCFDAMIAEQSPTLLTHIPDGMAVSCPQLTTTTSTSTTTTTTAPYTGSSTTTTSTSTTTTTTAPYTGSSTTSTTSTSTTTLTPLDFDFRTDCNDNTGLAVVVIEVTGAYGDVQYRVDGGVFQSNPLFTGLADGTHIITVVDSIGRIKDKTFTRTCAITTSTSTSTSSTSTSTTITSTTTSTSTTTTTTAPYMGSSTSTSTSTSTTQAPTTQYPTTQPPVTLPPVPNSLIGMSNVDVVSQGDDNILAYFIQESVTPSSLSGNGEIMSINGEDGGTRFINGTTIPDVYGVAGYKASLAPYDFRRFGFNLAKIRTENSGDIDVKWKLYGKVFDPTGINNFWVVTNLFQDVLMVSRDCNSIECNGMDWSRNPYYSGTPAYYPEALTGNSYYCNSSDSFVYLGYVRYTYNSTTSAETFIFTPDASVLDNEFEQELVSTMNFCNFDSTKFEANDSEKVRKTFFHTGGNSTIFYKFTSTDASAKFQVIGSNGSVLSETDCASGDQYGYFSITNGSSITLYVNGVCSSPSVNWTLNMGCCDIDAIMNVTADCSEEFGYVCVKATSNLIPSAVFEYLVDGVVQMSLGECTGGVLLTAPLGTRNIAVRHAEVTGCSKSEIKIVNCVGENNMTTSTTAAPSSDCSVTFLQAYHDTELSCTETQGYLYAQIDGSESSGLIQFRILSGSTVVQNWTTQQLEDEALFLVNHGTFKIQVRDANDTSCTSEVTGIVVSYINCVG